MFSIHLKYLFKKFTKKILLLSFIFFILVLIINLIEESNFLKESETTWLTPIILTFLNAPSLLYEMFPFIFLISTQFFFIDIYENREIDTLRIFGMNNFSLLKILITTTFIFGLFIITVFYNFSSILKNEYLKLKNNYAEDNKYLAVITKNGIWIKDTFDDEIIIINSDKIIDEFLINSSITKLDKNFNIKENIIAEKINIKDKTWKLFDVIRTDINNLSNKHDNLTINSNFDLEKVNNLFSDLSSLNFIELNPLNFHKIRGGFFRRVPHEHDIPI